MYMYIHTYIHTYDVHVPDNNVFRQGFGHCDKKIKRSLLICVYVRDFVYIYIYI